MPEMTDYPTNRAIVLKNATCAYCGTAFGPTLPHTREHVIGRRFVPAGLFAGQWNLILRACGPCNAAKAALEDDVAAISMMPDASGRYAIDDPRLPAEVARRAAKSRSRKTGKAVADSHEQVTLRTAFAGMGLTFNFTAAPQIDDARCFELARYHVGAFFYLITFQREARRGYFHTGGFFPLFVRRRADWGAPLPCWFTDRTTQWPHRVRAIAPDGFFKVCIRRHPDELPVWSWALEWNHAIRVAGFMGDEAAIQSLASAAPDEELETVHQDGANSLKFRLDVPLPEDDDRLFGMPDAAPSAGGM